MVDSWLDNHVGGEAVIRPEFERQLADRISAMWHGEQVVDLGDSTPTPPDRPRGRTLIWLGAAAAVIIAVVLVISTRSPHSSIRPADTEMPSPGTAATPTSAPDSPIPTVPPATATTSIETATTSSINATTSAAPMDTADLHVPLSGGEDLQPWVLSTIPIGSGPGQLALQNGEFATPIVALPDELIVFEDVPFGDGLTGRALILDRSGTWQRDVEFPEITGVALRWWSGTPNGTVLIAFTAANDDYTDATLNAYRLDGANGAPRLLKTVTFRRFDSLHMYPTATGVNYPSDTPIMDVDTGIVATDLIEAFEPRVGGGSVRVTITRGSSSWTIDEDFPPDPPVDTLPGLGPFGDGAWYSDEQSYAPGNDSSFLVLLSPAAEPRWYRFGGWSLSTVTDDALIFTTVTADGLRIGTIEAPLEPRAEQFVGQTIDAPTPNAPTTIGSISLPVGSSFFGGGVVGDAFDVSHVFLHYRFPSGTDMILLARFPKESNVGGTIVAALDIPRPANEITIFDCTRAGQPTHREVVALISPTGTGADQPAIRAWSIDPITERFSELDRTDISCQLGDP